MSEISKQTICINCSNKVIKKQDGKQYICPNIKYNATKIQSFWTSYDKYLVITLIGQNKYQNEVTYRVNGCKHFKQKQKPQPSKVFNIQKPNFKSHKSCIAYLPLNSKDDEELKILVEKRKVSSWASKMNLALKMSDKDEKKPLVRNRKKIFTPEETEFMKNNYQTMTQKEIANQLKASETSIYNAFKRLGLKRDGLGYTNEQEQQIRNFYNGLSQYKTLKEFASSIEKETHAVYLKAQRMGIKNLRRRTA